MRFVITADAPHSRRDRICSSSSTVQTKVSKPPARACRTSSASTRNAPGLKASMRSLAVCSKSSLHSRASSTRNVRWRAVAAAC